ncbi:methyltransferase domain-containing protein [Phlyctema vagabunda]|uniref:Methyltransferase domain-containing protein n=1 Tax=Phlyctema vagabunda TaxID=108571 RepID=A0ABR4PMA8_9HELO
METSTGGGQSFPVLIRGCDMCGRCMRPSIEWVSPKSPTILYWNFPHPHFLFSFISSFTSSLLFLISIFSMFDTFSKLAMNLIHPLTFMSIAIWYRIKTFFDLLLQFDIRTLASPSRFNRASFAKFWKVYGAAIASPERRATVAPLMAQASGIVIDVGPGTGEWINHFDLAKVTKIYGLEPNVDHHERLRKKIKDSGLSDIYTIVPIGAEDLGTFGIDRGSVDAITSVQSLCSVPNSDTVIKDLYGYLKQGGKWILYEHVVTRQTGVVAWVQCAIDVFWPHLLGGCSITRDTEQYLRDSGDWSSIDVNKAGEEAKYQMLPFFMGVLVK